MMTPAEIEMCSREIQRDRRAEVAAEAQARRIAPGPFDRLLAALRLRQPAQPQMARPARPVAGRLPL